ncbi:MAG: stage V sporulation protein AD [Syntrophomonadales bacterium]|jgi:stage V sporulation protein AD
MPGKKTGSQSITYDNPPTVASWATIVGPMEGEGPFGAEFDWVMEDYFFGEKSYEEAEGKMLREALRLAARKEGLDERAIEVVVAGDFLRQSTASNYAGRDLSLPFLGIYGACTTLAEGLILAGMIMDGGFYSQVAVGAVSHYHTAERQFRLPIELGAIKSASAQWPVTGAGAVLLNLSQEGPRITAATIGKVVDKDQADAKDLGGAEAPAAADTLITHFRDLGRDPGYYDLIVTGDLGKLGSALMEELCLAAGYHLGDRYTDCGVIIYDQQQNVQAGGRGCGSSAAMVCGPYLNRIAAGKIKRFLLVGTGAMIVNQRGSIPGIAHAIAIEAE